MEHCPNLHMDLPMPLDWPAHQDGLTKRYNDHPPQIRYLMAYGNSLPPLVQKPHYNHMVFHQDRTNPHSIERVNNVSVRGQLSISLLPLSSPALPLFICTFPIPLHHPQGPHSKADDSHIQSPMTFQKLTHRLSLTPCTPLHSYLSHIGWASDTLGLVHMTLRHPPLSHGHPFMGGLVIGGLVL
jgi:hypothetical protein